MTSPSGPQPQPDETTGSSAPTGEQLPQPGPNGDPTAGALIAIDAHFKMIFIVVVAFTAAFWLGYYGLIIFGSESETTKNAADTLKTAASSGVGSIFGLLGGAATGRGGA
ncbi:hypothetical protein ABT390_13560 [Streptomyces aurantiacus]|uniref:hypothetical protein n=1 Tax=Streptomyces aurantiacus TaxID=47760 RepID=UPI001319D9DB|nr:hypothetical protein [Streptomyces aurantiacus]